MLLVVSFLSSCGWVVLNPDSETKTSENRITSYRSNARKHCWKFPKSLLWRLQAQTLFRIVVSSVHQMILCVCNCSARLKKHAPSERNRYWYRRRVYSRKPRWQWKNHDLKFEDVSPIKDGGFSIAMLFYWRVILIQVSKQAVQKELSFVLFQKCLVVFLIEFTSWKHLFLQYSF